MNLASDVKVNLLYRRLYKTRWRANLAPFNKMDYSVFIYKIIRGAFRCSVTLVKHVVQIQGNTIISQTNIRHEMKKKNYYIIYNEINLQEGSAMLLYFPIHFSQVFSRLNSTLQPSLHKSPRPNTMIKIKIDSKIKDKPARELFFFSIWYKPFTSAYIKKFERFTIIFLK